MDRLVPRPLLPALTSLRFIAALVVVLGHLELQRLGPMPEVLRAWLESGYQAVTFFFVLSGFILVYVYSGASEQSGLSVTPTRFMVARLARVVPAYYLALLLLLPSFAYGFLIAGIVPLGRFVPAMILVPLMMQGWYPPVAFSWNGPAWSLSVEFFFYMLFPVLLKSTSGIARRPFVLTTIVAMIGASVLRLLFLVAAAGASRSWDYFYLYFPLFHLTSFLAGMALGRVFLFGSKPSGRVPALLFWAGLGGLLVVLGGRSTLPTWLQTDAVLIPLFGLVIYGGALVSGRLARILSMPLLVLLGDASYALYITHGAVIWWWRTIAADSSRPWVPLVAESAAVLVTVVGFSVLVLVCCERPLRRWILGRVGPRFAARPNVSLPTLS